MTFLGHLTIGAFMLSIGTSMGFVVYDKIFNQNIVGEYIAPFFDYSAILEIGGFFLMWWVLLVFGFTIKGYIKGKEGEK